MSSGDAVFEGARAHFIAGVQAYEAGRFDTAAQSFEAALALLPERVSTRLNLASTRLKLDQAQAALDTLAPVLQTLEPGNGEAWLLQGHALGDLGRDDEAIACYARLTLDDPHFRAACFHRALALNRLRRPAEALPLFEQLCRIDPTSAEAWWRRAQTLMELERADEALGCHGTALQHDPTLHEAWTERGMLLKDRGRLAEAAQCFREALAHGADAALNAYLLAATGGGDDDGPPRAAPARYVQGLFDGYAEQFDAHLQGALNYSAPDRLVHALDGLAPERLPAALDLGCGTGLCAPLLAGRVDALDGVDLSAPMLAKARERGLYRTLTQADITPHLQACAERYDLVIAADVFIYIGDLLPVFAGVRRVLQARGWFAFTIEPADDDQDFLLQPSARYAHGLPYLRRLAQANGFALERVLEAPLREQQRVPVMGRYLVLRAL